MALAYAKSVTIQTGDPDDLLPRSGNCSLFCILQEMHPQIVRNGFDGQRNGISEVELDKSLEVCPKYS